MKRLLIISVLMLTGVICLAQTPTMNVYQSGGSLLQLPLSNIDSVLFETVPPPSTMVIYQTGGTINSIVVSSIDSITYTVYNTPPPPQNGDWLNPNISYGSVTDIDGNVYPTVVIGNQEWMAENLRTTRYSNGDPIEQVSDEESWILNEEAEIGSWGYYGNDPSFNIPFGKYYSWYVAVDSRNACPMGWHVPTSLDWITLTSTLGGDTIAGTKMKSISQLWHTDGAFGHWATNESGFSAVPSGACEWIPYCLWMHSQAVYYSSTERTDAAGVETFMTDGAYQYFAQLPTDPSFSTTGAISIRCIRD